MSNESMLSPAHTPRMSSECAGQSQTDIMKIKDMVQQFAKRLAATRAEVAMLRERLVGQRPMMPTAEAPVCRSPLGAVPKRWRIEWNNACGPVARRCRTAGLPNRWKPS